MTAQYYAIACSAEGVVADGAAVATVRLSGEFDLGAYEDLQAAVQSAITAAQTRSIIVDLVEVTFIDAVTFSVLFSAYFAAQQQGKNFWVTGVRGSVQRVFDVLDETHLLQQGHLCS